MKTHSIQTVNDKDLPEIISKKKVLANLEKHYKPHLRDLGLLDTRLNYQAYPDAPEDKQDPLMKGLLTGTFYGTYKEILSKAVDYIAAGAAVAVVYHETRGEGRKKEDITQPRTVIIDADKGRIKELPWALSRLISTSEDKYHYFWPVKNLSCADFELLQEVLEKYYGQDSGAKPITQPFRIPGSYNWKNKSKPYLVYVVEVSPNSIILDWSDTSVSAEIIKLFPQAKNPLRPHNEAPAPEAGQGGRRRSPYRVVNEAALKPPYRWFKALFPKARKSGDTLRVRSEHLGRDLQEDIVIGPDGIRDHGLGPRKEDPDTAINLVMRWLPEVDGDRDKAVLWLCEQLEVDWEQIKEECAQQHGALVYPNDKGVYKMVIASKAAQEAVAHFRYRAAFHPISMTWYLWMGTHWEQDPRKTHLKAKLYAWLEEETYPRGYRYTEAKELLGLLEDQLHLFFNPNQEKDLIPFANGLFSIKTRQLTPHDPKGPAFTWYIPYNHNTEAKCPTIDQWLLEACDGDKEVVDLLLAFMAALILPNPAKYQKFLHLQGPGGTGKGTFIKLMQHLIGEHNGVSTDLEQLEKNQFETACLHDKRLAWVNEAARYAGSGSKLKAITGGDSLRLERKYQQADASFVFQGLVVIASNDPIRTDDKTSGLERRRVTVIFDKQFTDDEKKAWEDAGDNEQLWRELPGLINKLVDISEEEIARRIRELPEAVKRANHEAMISNNHVAAWLVERCEYDICAETPLGARRRKEESLYAKRNHLYRDYRLWCEDNGVPNPVMSNSFLKNVIDVCKNVLKWGEIRRIKREYGLAVGGLSLRNIEEFDPGEVPKEGPMPQNLPH
jgi:putative DNA primase/helicase